jgi:hypothetical protein
VKPREGALLLLTTAAAFAAALTCRVATAPHELGRPGDARAFEEARRLLPAIGALRVRSAVPDAARRLRDARLDVLDPLRAALEFRYGRLRWASPPEVAAALADVRRGVLPRLPPAPDVAGVFRDELGPYACDVLAPDAAAVARVREVLPDALLTGEPAARAAEEGAARDVTRALVAGLAVVAAWVAWRRRGVEAEARVFAALAPLAVLGIAGWGVDASTVPALLLVAAAPRGAPLLCAAPCLLFPDLALRRMGLVLGLGGLLRWGAAPRPPAGRERWPLLVPYALAGAAFPLLPAALPEARLPVEVRHEPSVTLVAAEGRSLRAREMREEGFTAVVGAEPFVPPMPDAETRRQLLRIHFLARDHARRAEVEAESGEGAGEGEAWTEVAAAAAVEGLHEPLDLRRRLRAEDRRAALWGYGRVPVDDPSFDGAALYRLRGQGVLRAQSVRAAVLVFLVAGTFLALARGGRALLPLLARFGGLLLAFAALSAAHAAGQPVAAETCLPVAVAASFAATWALLPALLAGAAFAGWPLLHVAVALLAATACGLIRR